MQTIGYLFCQNYPFHRAHHFYHEVNRRSNSTFFSFFFQIIISAPPCSSAIFCSHRNRVSSRSRWICTTRSCRSQVVILGVGKLYRSINKRIVVHVVHVFVLRAIRCIGPRAKRKIRPYHLYYRGECSHRCGKSRDSSGPVIYSSAILGRVISPGLYRRVNASPRHLGGFCRSEGNVI